MNKFVSRVVIICILITVTVLSLLVASPTENAQAGNPQIEDATFDSATFNCPDEISYQVTTQWLALYDGYVRAYDASDGTLIYDQFYPTEGTFNDSFTLPDPLPPTITLEAWVAIPDNILNYNPEVPSEKAAGLATIYQPSAPMIMAGPVTSPPLPGGYFAWNLTSTRLVTTADCSTLTTASCSLSVPIYGTALVTKPQVMYSGPNGEIVKDENGVPLPLLHDVDGDGADTYLIIDIATGIDGETWLGLFLGACDPVYVELQNVFPLGAIPVD